MTQPPPTWITVTDAATLSNRRPRTIYDWVRDHDVRSRKADDGTMRVHAVDVLEAESKKKRGRPARVT